MAFLKKTWKDTIAEYPNRRVLTNVSTGDTSTVTVTRSIGTVSQEGDAWNAENMNDLEDRIGNEFTTINSNLVANEYVITSDMWVSDTSNEDYPYKCTITSAKYKADGNYSAFVLPMATDSPFYTEEEKEFKDSLVFDNGYTSNGSISFWASEIPTVSIKFRIYGEN